MISQRRDKLFHSKFKLQVIEVKVKKKCVIICWYFNSKNPPYQFNIHLILILKYVIIFIQIDDLGVIKLCYHILKWKKLIWQKHWTFYNQRQKLKVNFPSHSYRSWVLFLSFLLPPFLSSFLLTMSFDVTFLVIVSSLSALMNFFNTSLVQLLQLSGSIDSEW